jgi:thymidylate synthase ThyX
VEYLLSQGISRKQARGAARGFLGNALGTELIFSASVAQWRRIIQQRACEAADGEIRDLILKCLVQLKKSSYSDRFEDIYTIDAQDGLGEIACFRT